MSDLHVVIGPPCSGKSSYVASHAKAGEVRIDFDLIAQALGSEVPHGSTGGIRSAAFSARQGAIDRVIDDGIPAWVIHTNPSDEQMARYEEAGAEFIEMDADLETCLQRAEEDGRPPETFAVIREWFEQHKYQKRSAPQGAFFLAREADEMPYRPERQYRNFEVTNFKPVNLEQTDGIEESEPTYIVRGYFTTFNEEYELFDDLYESIDSQAFAGCDMSDVIMQVNHDGFVFARTRNGSLKIGFDDHGGYCEADLSGSKQGREDLYEAITNGLIDRMSFGFSIADEGFEWSEDEDGIIHSHITRISKLYDVSAIAGFPANPGTEISARSYLDGAIEAERKRQELQQRALEEEEERKRQAISRRARAAAALELSNLR